MSEINEAYETGLEHHRAGRFLEAEISYRRVLELYPRHAGAVHLMGLIAFQVGKTELAAQYVEQAVKFDAFRAPYAADLGEIYRALGRVPEAIAAYRKALQLDPSVASVQTHLGTLLEAEDQHDEALACFHRALAIDPACAEAHAALGSALLGAQQFPEAQTALEKAAQLAPNNAKVYLKLGQCLQSQNKELEAIACFRKVAQLQPNTAAAHGELALAYQQRGQLEQAASHYRKALDLVPHLAEVHYNLGVVCHELGHPLQALQSFENAVRWQPEMFRAHLALANLHAALVHTDRSVEAARRASALCAESASASAQLARGLQIQGDTPGAIAAFRRAVELDPADAQVHSELVGALNAEADLDAAALLAAHRDWAKRHAEPLTAAARPHDLDRTPERRLRVGYVSPHFRQHANSVFILPLLAAHDRQRVEIVCYSDSDRTDEVTTRFQQAAEHWRPIAALSDEVAAEHVRSDKIDILVDLAGHFGNRLGIFARKPAPVQVAYLGYPCTTGMSAMDYRLTDAQSDPPDAGNRYTERLAWLPRSCCCYAPPEASPDVNNLPALDAGHVTLAWLAGTSRTTPQAVELWAQLLAAVPGARLLVLGYRGGVFEQRVQAAMARGGIDPARVEIVKTCPPDERLRLHHRIDLALDSFPLGGHATLCHALWMGVPCVVLESASRVARFGSSALASVGLTECIAHTSDEYLQIVAQLAGDLPRLAELRGRLRSQMSDAPLVDAAGLARYVESAYRQMWRAWCKRA